MALFRKTPPTALAFRSSEALALALRSGLCPADTAARGARVARSDDGTLVVAPDKPLPSAALAKLRAMGVAEAALPDDARAVRCWAEAIAPEKIGVPEIPSLVVFACERATDLIDLAAELVRLGCDRIELRAVGEQGFARVVDPPTYTVVRALDRERGTRVFAPDPPNQERVWTELGYKHPLAAQLAPEANSALLVAPDGWSSLPDGAWLGLDAALELAVPAAAHGHAAGKLPARRRVELRLSSGRRAAPSLWVLRERAVAAIDQLLAYLPEEIVARLTFAATGGDSPTIVVRARGGRSAPPELVLAGAEEYAPLAGVADVYAPAGAIVEPPLRSERLRAILDVPSGEIAWLARVAGDRFRVEHVGDAAFQPLVEWADYVVHASAPALAPWTRAATFDFAAYVSTGLEWASERADDDGAEAGGDKKKRKRPVRERVANEGERAAPLQGPKPAQPAPTPQPTKASELPASYVAIDQELAALEAEFVALDAPGDAPERLALLDRLGAVYARLGRRRDAGLCFARAVWEAPADAQVARLDAWIAADLAGKPIAFALDAALALASPDGDDVRLVAALAARAHPAIAKDPHRATRWLDDHDAELDARTLWLSRLGLGTLAGGDALGLAHARDRVLARLAGGLPVERELPAFLRFAGRTGALGNASGDQLATALDDLAKQIARTKRKRSSVEAPAAYTNAYVDLVLAHGNARIGKLDRARALVGIAKDQLAPVASEPVHAYLYAAFAARVDQAIGGLPAETALPDELGARLAAFDRLSRYKVDRLREYSRILEPHARHDAIGGFSRRQDDSRGAEFAALLALVDAKARGGAIGKLIDTAEVSDSERERLLDGIFDVLLELPESLAVPLAMRAHPLVARVAEPRRAPLYAEALVVAGHFGRAELTPTLLDALLPAMVAAPAAELERTLQTSLRALRRMGLRREIAAMLARAEQAMTTNRADLRARLAIASGLAYLGESERALAIFDEGRKSLATSMTLTARLELTRALAIGYSQAPIGSALAGIAELAGQLKDITDSFNTNSHYCLSVVTFVESLVLGIASDDLALGEAGRRFVEDDEHLIRRRLHRDLSA